MQSRIVVVALDIKRHPTQDFHKFSDQKFEGQLAQISRNIEEVCAVLAAKEKDATQWIISWREYGITDEGLRYITVPQRKKLKAAMQALTAK